MEYRFRMKKASIYVNTKKKTLAQIKEETGCDVIINGGYYNMTTFKPVCHLKVDGEVLVSDPYKYWGFAWNADDSSLTMTNEYSGYENYICCCALCKDGKETWMTDGAKERGKRGRTALGILPSGEVIIYCAANGSADAITPVNLQKYVIEHGWKDALMLDGGGSSQCITPDSKITSTRKVHNVLCFWLMDNKNGEDEDEVNGVSVKAYSKAKDGKNQVSKNFKVSEFACEDGSDPIFIAPELVTVLQKIRTYFGKPVTINSAYRTPTHNKKVGGKTYSQHLYGTAADIVVKGVTPKKVAAYVEKIMPSKGGIGIYSSFVHVDVRKAKSRWNG